MCHWCFIPIVPSISQYQPNLFSTILPTLRDPTNFVISLYIRTGHTEALQIPERTEQYRGTAERIVQCALYLEQQEHQQQRDGGGNMSNSSNNSRSVPRKVVDAGDRLTLCQDMGYANLFQQYILLPRTILVTQSRGAHTKGSPSTADVAEGFLDWYLIENPMLWFPIITDQVLATRLRFGRDDLTIRCPRNLQRRRWRKAWEVPTLTFVAKWSQLWSIRVMQQLNSTAAIVPATVTRSMLADYLAWVWECDL
ncbi:hypothetical protein MHU86_7715 [Fragilaria crotonensis]|nr:hypothetical protein MHU86_7715 [Fragilaria crotonensis]